MSTSVQPAGASQTAGRGGPTGLADVIDTILDKGLVIDAYVRVSLVGIEILTIDTRIVIASVDTYLRFAEAANRLDMNASGPKGLPDVLEQSRAGGAVEQQQDNVIQGEIERSDDELDRLADDATSTEAMEEEEEPPVRPRRKRQKE
ncbi:gas vesicle protein GvpJ [Nonomuraea zeae]|uniref:Gas vesicle protein A n=1 Tax=Nonomuraea zeae TaxID=1642303 RepID=A0A5S4G631_9ACTN|nr:gas vesicle protein GvpJ [Nonomuraea zeae]TMR28477.1 gas vesicle protein [Nonomuraea zeae]